VKTTTGSWLVTPSTTTTTLSTWTTSTSMSTTTSSTSTTTTTTVTTCSTLLPIPTNCGGCQVQGDLNLCDETTFCEPSTGLCKCKQGYKYESSLSSTDQWRQTIGDAVYVQPGLRCDMRKLCMIYSWLACADGNINCPEVQVKVCTARTAIIPSTATTTLSTTTTLTSTSSSTTTTTSTITSTSTTCSVKNALPTSCTACDPLAENNMCDETTVCDDQKHLCVCKLGYKHESIASSTKQWRLIVGGPVYVHVGDSCSIRK
jgi:hypothetical protein